MTSIYAAYVSAVGVNAIIPVRGGDAVKLYLAHRAVPGSTYTALASTLLVLSIFDAVIAAAIFIYALTLGVLPGAGALGGLPASTSASSRPTRSSRSSCWRRFVIFGVIGFFWARLHIDEFERRVFQGFTVLRDRTEYLRRVAAWQAADWTLRFVAIWFFLGAFNVDQDLRNIFLVQLTQSLATLVPISPGGIGTEQAFIVFVFTGLPVPRSLLLAFSVGMKLHAHHRPT